MQLSGMHLYGGWFLLCGEIAEGAEWRPAIESREFKYWFTENFPSGGSRSEGTLCAVEFCTSVPWGVGGTGTPHRGR